MSICRWCGGTGQREQGDFGYNGEYIFAGYVNCEHCKGSGLGPDYIEIPEEQPPEQVEDVAEEPAEEAPPDPEPAPVEPDTPVQDEPEQPELIKEQLDLFGRPVDE